MRALLLATLGLSFAALAEEPSRANAELLQQLLPLPPGGKSFTPFGTRINGSGVPMAVGVVETAKNGAEVLEFYARHFDGKRWAWSGIKQNLAWSPWPTLSATLPDDLQLTVIALEREGGTSVVLGLADMREFYRRLDGAAPEAGLPTPPSVHPSVLDIAGEGGGRAITFASPQSVDELQNFYATRPGLGWTALGEHYGARHFELRVAGQTWRVRIQKRDRGSQFSAVLVGGGP
jgi:hypothetical protein